MEQLKNIVLQAMFIAVSIFAILGIQMLIGHMNTGRQSYEFLWYTPLAILATAFISALPSIILYTEGRIGVGRYLLHFFSVAVIVMVAGRLFVWYRSVKGFFMLLLMFMLVYGLTWLVMAWLTKREEQAINQALREIQDEDE
ncbi:MAG: DUF3021 family protein [Eubacteriales bacterium]|nr:DUF3021 family protein [Eubacteriales bacterium]